MQNAIHSACRRNLCPKWSKKGGERKVTWRGGGGALLVWLLRWRCCGGGRWRCRCYKRRSERLLLFPSPSFSFLFCCYVYLSFCSSLSVFFYSQTLPCFKLVFLSLSLSLYRLLSFSFPLVFFFVLCLFFVMCWRWVVYIGQRERGHPYCRPIAAHGEQGFTALSRRRLRWPTGSVCWARLC